MMGNLRLGSRPEQPDPGPQRRQQPVNQLIHDAKALAQPDQHRAELFEEWDVFIGERQQ